MTPELTAYTAALCVAAFAVGTIFGIWLRGLFHIEDVGRAYDDGYSDGAQRRPRKWPT
jgi:hypothetical protein